MKTRILLAGVAALAFAAYADAQVKISELPEGAAVQGPHPFPTVQDATTVRVTASQIATFVNAVGGDITNKTISGATNSISGLNASNVFNAGVVAQDFGGTGRNAALSDDQLLLSNGSLDLKAVTVPDCQDTGGNHLNYTASTNTISCGTSGGGGGGVSQTTGTFNINWTDACTTTPTTAIRWVATGNVVTWRLDSTVVCTGDSVNFLSSADVPVAIRPTTQTETGLFTINNGGTAGTGCLQINTNGTVAVRYSTTFAGGPCGNASNSWTASGTRVLGGPGGGTMIATYLLN